jgi:hypothetical protein
MTAPVLSMPASLIRLDPQGASTHAIMIAQTKPDMLVKLYRCWRVEADIFVDMETDNQASAEPKRLKSLKNQHQFGPRSPCHLSLASVLRIPIRGLSTQPPMGPQIPRHQQAW